MSSIEDCYPGGKCDPDKAKDCKKESCYYRFDEQGKRRGNCRYTTNPRYMLDEGSNNYGKSSVSD